MAQFGYFQLSSADLQDSHYTANSGHLPGNFIKFRES